MRCDKCGAELNEQGTCLSCGYPIDAASPEPEDPLNSVAMVRDEVLSADAASKFQFIGNTAKPVKKRKKHGFKILIFLMATGSLVITGLAAIGVYYWYVNPFQKSPESVNVARTVPEKSVNITDTGKQQRPARERHVSVQKPKKRKKPERAMDVSRKNYVPPSAPPAEIIEAKQSRPQKADKSLIEEILNRPNTNGTQISRDPRETGL